ncbi:MAG: hypothetical protein A3I61_10065 [Acidobacteria bacterium RIFCSPLOWO2_02_FULL_68_18]|nr:MAG: hypothetical protein A3I61_10065 [Acidobacteria bacterium RIFCSPLOWO2_02_FULL_68_18]OFW50953.1 MAG: hypothetical protein A3G77_15100 [Acidobacteria bacterium RIFCSPLOWO2_12_FULL_68_19]
MYLVVATLMGCGPSLGAQQLLDRVAARVNGFAITLSDVTAAVALGLVEVPEGAAEQTAVERLVDRQLVLAEVARFAPPEPSPAAVAREVAAISERTGGRLAAVMESTGLDDARLREMARDNLRIAAYLDQRFGSAVQLAEEEVLQYYRMHPEEFTRGGRLMPFVDADDLARERAGAERRAATIAQWMRDLRGRADIVIPRTPPPGAPRAY